METKPRTRLSPAMRRDRSERPRCELPDRLVGAEIGEADHRQAPRFASQTSKAVGRLDGFISAPDLDEHGRLANFVVSRCQQDSAEGRHEWRTQLSGGPDIAGHFVERGRAFRQNAGAELWFDDLAAVRDAIPSPAADALRANEEEFVGDLEWFIGEEQVKFVEGVA